MTGEIKIDGNSIQIGNKVCYCVDEDLIDYITNLQQNYNKLQDDYQEQYTYEYNLRKQLQQENERLKEENEMLKEYIKMYKCDYSPLYKELKEGDEK